MSGALPEGPARDLARVLARRLDDRDGPADAPLTVAELRRELLSYPSCREAAGLASKAEYDLAVLDLLAAPAVLAVEDPDLSEVIESERTAAEPGLGFLEGFAAATLRPGPALTGRASSGSTGWAGSGSTASGDAASSREVTSRDAARPGDSGNSSGTTGGSTPSGAPCWACGRELPGRDGLRYCPWCGADQRTPRCGSCREPLEAEWDYCPACGAPAASAASGGG